jgi:nitroreductase
MNPILESILQRKSVRHYLPDIVPSEDLEKIVRAGMSAPSAVNRQPWAFVAITDRQQLDILGDALPYAKMLLQAPAAIVVCGDLRQLSDGNGKFWVQDVSAATENILLAAEALGYGAVWTGVYPESDRMSTVTETLDLPERVIPFNVIPLGTPREGRDRPKDKWDPQRLHRDRW